MISQEPNPVLKTDDPKITAVGTAHFERIRVLPPDLQKIEGLGLLEGAVQVLADRHKIVDKKAYHDTVLTAFSEALIGGVMRDRLENG